MNYFDPARPRICGRPAYMAEGKAIAPLPLFCVEPKDEGGYTISFMLVHDDGGGVWYEHECTNQWELGQLLTLWRVNPEAVLADLGWTYRLLREPALAWSEDEDDELETALGATTLSLDDIE